MCLIISLTMIPFATLLANYTWTNYAELVGGSLRCPSHCSSSCMTNSVDGSSEECLEVGLSLRPIIKSWIRSALKTRRCLSKKESKWRKGKHYSTGHHHWSTEKRKKEAQKKPSSRLSSNFRILDLQSSSSQSKAWCQEESRRERSIRVNQFVVKSKRITSATSSKLGHYNNYHDKAVNGIKSGLKSARTLKTSLISHRRSLGSSSSSSSSSHVMSLHARHTLSHVTLSHWILGLLKILRQEEPLFNNVVYHEESKNLHRRVYQWMKGADK